MTTNARLAGSTEPADEGTLGAPIEVDLQAGSVAITPVHVDGETRFALTDLPDAPLTEDDVEGLAVALQVARYGPAVLVDIEDYAETESSPETDAPCPHVSLAWAMSSPIIFTATWRWIRDNGSLLSVSVACNKS